MTPILDALATIDGPIRLLIYGEFILFLTILAVRSPPRRFRLPLVTLILCSACYLHLSGPWEPAEGVVRLTMIGLTSVTPLVLWGLALLIFDDSFVLPRWAWPVAIAFAVTAGALDLSGELEPALRNILRVASLFALLHAVWVMISGLRDDLVERRRLARLILVGMLIFQAIASLLTELALPSLADREPLEPLAALFILVLTTGLAAALLRPEQFETLPPSASEPVPTSEAQQPTKDGTAENLAETELLRKLAQLARTGGLFDPGLTIAVLADRLAVPEYRLRRAINGGLGFRNFSAYLNHHRITEACTRLKDPNLAKQPVLTIAMDLGYGSLGPFNRAFKETTGVTPTEYRRSGSERNLADI